MEPRCSTCATQLRWYGEQGWGCDRCRAFVDPRSTPGGRSWGGAITLAIMVVIVAVVVAIAPRGDDPPSVTVVAPPQAPAPRVAPPPPVAPPEQVSAVPAAWSEHRHPGSGARVAFPAPPVIRPDKPELAFARGRLGFYSLIGRRVPAMDDAELRAWLDGSAGIAVIVAGLPARRSSRRATIGKATDVAVEELFVVDVAGGWAYQLMTSSVPAPDAERFFATFRIDRRT